MILTITQCLTTVKHGLRSKSRDRVKSTPEGKWLLSMSQFTVILNIWDCKILAFKNGWLLSGDHFHSTKCMYISQTLCTNTVHSQHSCHMHPTNS